MKNQLADLVDLYNRNYARNEEWNLSDYRKGYKPIIQLIEDAVWGRGPRVNRDKHQFRIPKSTLEEMVVELSKPEIIEELKRRKCFDDIFTIVYELKRQNFGSLAVYDTSLRLGAIFSHFPNVVYLHQGALEGSINLLGKEVILQEAKYFVDNPDYPYLSLDVFPEPINKMEPYHVENFLCIFKNKFN